MGYPQNTYSLQCHKCRTTLFVKRLALFNKTKPCSQKLRIAYSSYEPSASSGVCVRQSSFCSNVHDIMDDHFLNGNNLISKNVQISKHQHTRTHPPSVCSQIMFIHVGHTLPDQIELYCHLYAARSTNLPVTPCVTTMPTASTWPAVTRLGKSGDRWSIQKPPLFQLPLNARPVR